MIPIETITLFFAASVALALTPGPDNIFVLTQSAIHGRKAGVVVTIGLCTGLLAHTAAVSLGVAAIFQTSTLAFNTLKIIGALYLLYLAWLSFRTLTTTIDQGSDNRLSNRQLYLRGVIMNITNPKVAIFFLAFLPQFIDATNGSISTQMIMLGGIFIIAAFLIFGSIAWFAGFLGSWLKGSDKAQIIMNRVAGIIFIGLALRLVLTEH